VRRLPHRDTEGLGNGVVQVLASLGGAAGERTPLNARDFGIFEQRACAGIA